MQEEKFFFPSVIVCLCVCPHTCACVCVRGPLQKFQGHCLYYKCGMRNQHLHYKNGYVNTEGAIIRRHGVGTG